MLLKIGLVVIGVVVLYVGVQVLLYKRDMKKNEGRSFDICRKKQKGRISDNH